MLGSRCLRELIMLDFRDLRVRISPWLALTLGVIFVLSALVSKGAAVTWRDLYPGACLIAAGFLLFGLLKYLRRQRNFDEPQPGSDEESLNAHR
jgi:uncharacterized BrkB/YihY/UPF0761 family membrane protein